MEIKNFKVLAELIENCGHASKLLVNGEMAVNDGDLELSQKNVIEAQSFIKVLMDDVFKEIIEEFGESVTDVNDYDLPCVLELAKQLSDVVYNAGVLIGLYIDNQSELITTSIKKKIHKSINTVCEVYTALFLN